MENNKHGGMQTMNNIHRSYGKLFTVAIKERKQGERDYFVKL